MGGKANSALVLLYLGLTLVAAAVYRELDKPLWAPPATAVTEHQRVVEGESGYPNQYRPLVPWACELAHRAGLPLEAAYLLQRLACWFLALLLLHQYLRAWLREEACLAGGVFLAALLPFSCLAQGWQPTDPLNLLLYVLAYRLLLTRQDVWLLPLLAVGMLNRETIGLVILLAAAVRWDERGSGAYWRLLALLTAVALAVFAAVRWHYGAREPDVALVTPAVNIPENLTRAGSLRFVLLYGVLWLLALRQLGTAPIFLRRSLLLLPVFAVVHLCVGLLGETRYFLPLAPTVLPLALRQLLPGAALEEPACE
ncbi:MAG: hypothetical protein IT204_01275 [Fimbriimonadaceae bacterium]|nr:hypothetical protein [Fimbriimonadaceae bacterium]